MHLFNFFFWIYLYLKNIYWVSILCKFWDRCWGRMTIIFTMASWGLPWAPLVAQRIKHLAATWETQVWSLGQEDPLEKEMATHSGTLAWKIPWMEKSSRLQSMGSQSVRHNWATSLSLFMASWISKFPRNWDVPWYNNERKICGETLKHSFQKWFLWRS